MQPSNKTMPDCIYTWYVHNKTDKQTNKHSPVLAFHYESYHQQLGARGNSCSLLVRNASLFSQKNIAVQAGRALWSQ